MMCTYFNFCWLIEKWNPEEKSIDMDYPIFQSFFLYLLFILYFSCFSFLAWSLINLGGFCSEKGN